MFPNARPNLQYQPSSYSAWTNANTQQFTSLPQDTFINTKSNVTSSNSISSALLKKSNDHKMAVVLGLVCGTLVTIMVKPSSIKLLPLTLAGFGVGYLGYENAPD